MCGGPTTKDSTPPPDTGAPTNSHNKDSSSKELSNTPLPIHFFHAECGGEFDDPGIGEPLGVFGVERPLSCKGNSCGNAVVESTNRPLEKGLDHRTRYTSVDRLRAELNDCVYWFNNQRLHSMLG